jgi:membrane protein
MIKKPLQRFMERLTQVVTQPQNELSRWQSFVRYAYDLGRYGARALRRDKAPQMASALAFRTLFALLPVVVVSTVVVKAVGGADQFKPLVSQIIASLGLSDVEFYPPQTIESGGHSTVSAEGPVSLGPWLEELVAGASQYNLSALGWVGLAVVIFSAIWLMISIENSFNMIYGAPEGRSWARSVPMYWLVLTMSPVFIGVTFYVDSKFGNLIEGMDAWKWTLSSLKIVWGFCVAWLFMFGIYKFVPNTLVATRAAMVGGFVAALSLQILKSSLGAYFENAVSLRSLYGSLGLIPVFMFWVYLLWLMILFGLEVSATVQTLHGRRLEELEEKRRQNGMVDPAAVLLVMELVTERFMHSLPTTPRQISDETSIAEWIVVQIVDHLVRCNMLHRVTGEEGAVTVARPPDKIPVKSLIELGYEMVDQGQETARRSAFLQRLRDAQQAIAARATLASVVAERPEFVAASQAIKA